MWKEQSNANVWSLRSREDEGRDNRILKQRRCAAARVPFITAFILGWWRNPESEETWALSLQFIYISNQVALTREKGIPGKKCN